MTNKDQFHNLEAKSHNFQALGKMLIDKSTIYSPAKVYLNYVLNEKRDQTAQSLTTASERMLARQYQELLTLTGISDNPTIKIGAEISIDGTKEQLGKGCWLGMEAENSQRHLDAKYLFILIHLLQTKQQQIQRLVPNNFSNALQDIKNGANELKMTLGQVPTIERQEGYYLHLSYWIGNGCFLCGFG